MRRHLAQAGLRWSVGRVTLLMLLSASVALAIAMKFDLIPGLIALLIACAVGALPYLYILRRRTKRFRKFEENLPDALDSLLGPCAPGIPSRRLWKSWPKSPSSRLQPKCARRRRMVTSELPGTTRWRISPNAFRCWK